MKIHNTSSSFLSAQASNPAFKKAQFIKSPDLDELINFASTDKSVMQELMIALEMLAQKNKNTMLKYTTSNNGEINIENLNTGTSVIKINEYNRPSLRDNLKSLCRFAMPSDEQHQKLLGEGMSKHQSDELKDLASLAVYEAVKKHPASEDIKILQNQIKELENKKSIKLKEIIYSNIYCD